MLLQKWNLKWFMLCSESERGPITIVSMLHCVKSTANCYHNANAGYAEASKKSCIHHVVVFIPDLHFATNASRSESE